ncbi:MAG: hypothetical protein IKX26_05605 [Bacteroidales bacterium]|nr:hypothetical protein [Bacteroidales bacterium]
MLTISRICLLEDSFQEANGKHINTKDIKKHRSDVLKNVVIMEDTQIKAPNAIVSSIRDFVASIRNEWSVLSEPLAKALDREVSFVEVLLERLDGMFVAEK